MSRANAIILFLSFGISTALGPVLIPMLTRLKVGQTERKEGVASHLKKAGTPTMGGIMILIAFLIPMLFMIRKEPGVLPILVMTLGYGLIGFLDDYLKVVLRRSDGLMPKQKMAFQIALTAVFVVYLWIREQSRLDIMLPFTGGRVLTGTAVHVIAALAAFVVVIGTVNGVNFTDGLDGLAASVTAVVCIFFFIVSTVWGEGIESSSAAMLGALLGFLVHNAHPARVFMGDTGSLALGGFVAASAYMMRMPLFIVIFGLVYLVEVLSVIIQVTYFKKTGGKRIFKMAPIHHHFELCGWSETRIVTIFSIVTFLLCVLAWLGRA